MQASQNEVVPGSTSGSFVMRSSTGKYLVQVLWYEVDVLCASFCVLGGAKSYWEVFCARFAVQSSTGKDFLQLLS